MSAMLSWKRMLKLRKRGKGLVVRFCLVFGKPVVQMCSQKYKYFFVIVAVIVLTCVK